MTTRLLLKTDGSVVTYDHALSMTAIREMVAPKTKTLDTVSVKRACRIELGRPWMPRFDATLADKPVISTVTAADISAGHVLIVDDTGLIDARPLNYAATQIYRAQCRPEYQHQAQIAGDAFVCPDSDFA